MHATVLDTLQDPTVRDLAWVIGSPGLADASHPPYRGRVVDDAWCSAQLRASAAWLAELDLSPSALHDFVAARPTRRLGHYFEALIAYWLAHAPDMQLIATNLQVQQEQRTQGEYDFLFRDASAALCHWEAAVKFYLQVEPRAEQRAFIGPGARDRLDLKLKRVFEHQLLLGQTQAGQQALPQGLKLDKAQAFVKGYLFYHASAPHPAPVGGVSAAHLSGWWVRHAREPLPRGAADSRWMILPRLRWLAPVRQCDEGGESGVMTRAALDARLDEHFSSSTAALLAIEMARAPAGEWRERSRGFVVCSSWPLVDGVNGQL